MASQAGDVWRPPQDNAPAGVCRGCRQTQTHDHMAHSETRVLAGVRNTTTPILREETAKEEKEEKYGCLGTSPVKEKCGGGKSPCDRHCTERWRVPSWEVAGGQGPTPVRMPETAEKCVVVDQKKLEERKSLPHDQRASFPPLSAVSHCTGGSCRHPSPPFADQTVDTHTSTIAEATRCPPVCLAIPKGEPHHGEDHRPLSLLRFLPFSRGGSPVHALPMSHPVVAGGGVFLRNRPHRKTMRGGHAADRVGPSLPFDILFLSSSASRRLFQCPQVRRRASGKVHSLS